MSAFSYRLRLWLFVFIAFLAVLNVAAPWGDDLALRGQFLLRAVTAVGAVVCGVVVARQVTGSARWWRLLLCAGILAWLVGEALWWAGGGVTDDREASDVGLFAYLVCPFFAMAAVILLVRSSRGAVVRNPLGATSVAATVIDGLVAGASFTVLAALGNFGGWTVAALPHSGIAVIDTGFVWAELVVVVSALVLAMVYAPNRPYRSNFLLLAGGIMAMASGDRVVAYFESIGSDDGQRWGGVGLVIGTTMLAYAMLDWRPSVAEDDGSSANGLDWAQMILPYLGFLGTAQLAAYHELHGHHLSPLVIWILLLMALLITIRQVLAVRSLHLLAVRLLRAQRGLAHQVFHDSLTGLPNRLMFAQKLDEARRGGQFVLIFVDLDDFKEVNDRFGHAAGDELLCAVGERLRRCVGETDTLARIGGDEFAILVEGDMEPEVVADRLCIALRNPFAVQGSSVRVRASMGLVRSGSDALSQTTDDLLRQADISMYAGKRLGKNTAVVYQPSAGVRADFPTVLREAAGGVPEGFSLAYQPVVSLPDGTPRAVEVLARWTAPNGIRISPETFVAVAESAGLGAVLDALVLDMACRDVAAVGLEVDIHVNIGAARLGNLAFEEQVLQTLGRHRIPPSRLVVEITETVPIVDLAAAAGQIKRLNAHGIKVALDDFGAGYNSLAYLHTLPVQVVKLDRSLAVGVDPERDAAVYRSAVGLCDALDVSVIAEGIETEVQAETVYRAGCRLAQGHLFGSPVDITELRRCSAGADAPTAPRPVATGSPSVQSR